MPEVLIQTLVYGSVIIPGTCFVLLYLGEWRHIRHTGESYQLIVFISILMLIALDAFLRNVLNLYPENRWGVRAMMIIAALCLWYLFYALLRYQVLPRMRRKKLTRRLRKLKAEEDRLSGQG